MACEDGDILSLTFFGLGNGNPAATIDIGAVSGGGLGPPIFSTTVDVSIPTGPRTVTFNAGDIPVTSGTEYYFNLTNPQTALSILVGDVIPGAVIIGASRERYTRCFGFAIRFYAVGS